MSQLFGSVLRGNILLRLLPLPLLLCIILISNNPVRSQIIVVPKTHVEEPFKNNPKWEDFKTAQFDRIKVLGTLAANVWTFLDNLGADSNVEEVQELFARYHIPPLVEFFRQSESRLSYGNPYAILDPAIGIHTMESLYGLSNLLSHPIVDQVRIKWTELDAMTLPLHLFFNETMRKILESSGQPHVGQDILSTRTKEFLVWISHLSGEAENGTMKSFTLDDLSAKIDNHILSLGKEHHLMRGLVQLLTSMIQRNVDMREELNYYCYGNNEFGILQDIYDVLTDAALYMCLADMKKLALDVVFMAYSTILKDNSVPHSEDDRKKAFQDMVDKIKKKIDFEYLQGSDYTELPHSPIFKCDKTPEEIHGLPSQWGRNITTGLSPLAGATYHYDPQAGPEKEDGNVGYYDFRRPRWEFLQFDKSYHGYLEAEIVLSPEGLCRGTCKDYRRPTQTCTPEKGIDCKGYRDSHCETPGSNCMDNNQCPEYAKDCIRAASTVTMCTSHQGDRHYSHFHLHPDPDQILGFSGFNDTAHLEEDRRCKGDTRVAKERWEMEYGVILRNPQYCELCVCTCMTPQNPDDQHYIDLTPQEADVENGYIVSAVRFVQEDKVLRLAIEQGKPLAAGDIDLTSTNWVSAKPVDKHNHEQTSPLGTKGFLRWNFDIVTGDAHQVVTGVRLSVDKEKSVYLQVQVTPITWPERSPSDIKLKAGEKTWIVSQVYHDVPRTALTFTKPNTPAQQHGPSMPDVVYNSYVEFQATDYEEDLGQSTIPFFDAQPVHHFETKRWLQGVGIMHKGKPRSGGFISPLIIPSKGRISADFVEARRRRR